MNKIGINFTILDTCNNQLSLAKQCCGCLRNHKSQNLCLECISSFLDAQVKRLVSFLVEKFKECQILMRGADCQGVGYNVRGRCLDKSEMSVLPDDDWFL